VHGLRSGPGSITGLIMQWQNGKQLCVWPKQFANGKLTYPKFVKLPR
jgi:branched-chain amino acid transport system substrate-binding protein